MADEKKYSAKEVALAVLAKAQEMLTKSEVVNPDQTKKVATITSGMHTVEYYSSTPFEKGEQLDCGFEPFQKMELSKAHGVHSQMRGEPAGTSIAGAALRYKDELPPKHRKRLMSDVKESHKEKISQLQAQAKPNLPKSEEMSKANPDEKQDAQLGEEVEGLCERHMLENKDAERKEGHKIVKAEMCKMCKSGKDMQKSEFSDLYEELEAMEKAERAGENEIGTKFISGPDRMNKAENKAAPSNPMKPRVEEEQAPQREAASLDTQAGKSSTSANDERQAEQAAPQANPAEKIEGNNPPAGSVPGKGVHKLSFFMGHRHHKRGMKKGIALG